MQLFFYGTLLDPDVQALVLGRALGPNELIAANLHHFRRVYIAGRAFPMILPHRGGAVDGAVAGGLSRDDLARIALYEGDDYGLERHLVIPAASEKDSTRAPIAAWLYRGRRHARPSTRSWQLAAWQAKEKASYLRDTRAWLESRLPQRER
jgi:hypothetical protein